MKDKIALVTGGTSGIGKKIVEHLLKKMYLFMLIMDIMKSKWKRQERILLK